MDKLSDLPNIGNVLEKQLKEVGINDYDELKKVGSMQVWLRIKDIDKSACYNRLCALEGAIQKVPKIDLSENKKKELKEFYNNFK